jgi:serine/threonine protein kinase
MIVSTDTVKTLFLEALDRPEAERAAFLDAACAGDTNLRERVEALLHSHHRNDSFLDPCKLHPASGHTKTSAFDNTTTASVRATEGWENSLFPWLQPSSQPNSLGRIRHYEVLEELGQGGFGLVYRVFDEKLHRIVALKVLSPTLASQSSARQRFLREARAAAAVRHEHVISIHDVEEEPIPHLVMEFIHGQTLQSKIDKNGPLKLKEILRIGMQMAMGLEAAHRQGLIHRDIKPSNILLENGIERVKISDFGLARAVDDTSISHQGMIMGTPAFMSPQQAEGLTCDSRCDLFSLGSTMHAMCTGQPPFSANSTLGMLKQVTEKTATPVSKANPELPAWLDEIVGKLMAKAPGQRYQTAKDVSDVLAARLAELQGPVVSSSSRRMRGWVLASTILVVFILLAFTERWGLTRLTPPIIKLFHHRLPLELPSRDTIVEIWMTKDTKDESPKRKSTFAFGKFEAYVTVVNTLKQTVTLPPGNYYVQARHQGKRIEQQLIEVGWGGSRLIKITLPDTESKTAVEEPILFKRYDPAKDKPTAVRGDPATTVKVEGNTWRLENNTHTGNFRFSFPPVVEGLPRCGVVICKAKIKLKAKSDNGWGELQLANPGPDQFGYDWPVQHYRYQGTVAEWTAKEVRYPAHAFWEKSPPQLTIEFGLHDDGVLQVKDLELWVIPGSEVPVSSILLELEELYKHAESALKISEERYRRGIVGYDVVVQDRIKCFDNKLQQARERKNHLEVCDYLKRIRDEHRTLLRTAEDRLKAGVITEREVIPAREALLQADLRLKEAKEVK